MQTRATSISERRTSSLLKPIATNSPLFSSVGIRPAAKRTAGPTYQAEPKLELVSKSLNAIMAAVVTRAVSASSRTFTRLPYRTINPTRWVYKRKKAVERLPSALNGCGCAARQGCVNRNATDETSSAALTGYQKPVAQPRNEKRSAGRGHLPNIYYRNKSPN